MIDQSGGHQQAVSSSEGRHAPYRSPGYRPPTIRSAPCAKGSSIWASVGNTDTNPSGCLCHCRGSGRSAASKTPGSDAFGAQRKILELVEHVVYGGRNACVLPHVKGFCLILMIGESPKYARASVFQGLISSGEGWDERSPVTV